MEQKNLGSLTVSALGLGCMGMSEFYGPTDEAESITHDPPRARARASPSSTPPTCTAPATTSELVGQAIADRRDEVVLATKFGNRREGDKRWIDNRPE